jgi:hypothetical protein
LALSSTSFSTACGHFAASCRNAAGLDEVHPAVDLVEEVRVRAAAHPHLPGDEVGALGVLERHVPGDQQVVEPGDDTGAVVAFDPLRLVVLAATSRA